MRILIVAQDFPWPSRYGSRIRLANVVRALGHLGDVDLFTFLWPGGEWEPPAAGAVKRWQMVPRPLARRTPLRRLAWILGGRAPSDFLGRDFEAVREAFTAWAQPRYDLIWFSRIEPYVAFGSLVDGPVILDIDDLADWRLRTRAAAGLGNDSAGAISWPSIRTLPKRLKDRKDIRLWDRLQKRLAGSVAAAVVCSEQDRQRVGVSNVVVVPNGYEAPARPAGRLATGRPPTVLFPATFGYPPNLDAARYLVQEIAPLLGARVGDLQIRLVGKAVRAVRELADPPRVVVTGAVPEMDPELRHADIVAVPIRIGTGTRIKVLEAFAHKIPVVATSVGAEGLDVRHGTHLLIADSPQDFASACSRVLEDARLRRSLVKEAHELFLQKYQWEGIRSSINDMARSTSIVDPNVPSGSASSDLAGASAASRRNGASELTEGTP